VHTQRRRPSTSTQLTSKQLTPDQISTIHAALATAGLTGVKINSMHLTPMDDHAAGGPGTCHAVELPNGEIHIICV
jgi:hypothetical protein